MNCDILSVVKSGLLFPHITLIIWSKIKPRNLWAKKDKENMQYNLKTKTDISTTLGID